MEGSQCFHWESELGPSINWLPESLQEKIASRTPTSEWLDKEAASYLAVILDIQQEYYSQAVQRIERTWGSSPYGDGLLLLRARALAGLGRFVEMFDVLTEAATRSEGYGCFPGMFPRIIRPSVSWG